MSEKLLKNKDVELVGLKALVETKEKTHEASKTLALANKAFEIRQDLYWVLENTFYLRAKAADWKGALEVLEAGFAKKLIEKEKYRSFKSVVLYELALQEKENGNSLLCLRHLMLAHELNPYFVCPALELAKFYLADNQLRKAEKIIKDVWRKNPTDALAKAYLNLYPNDTAIERVKRMEALARLNISVPSLNNFMLADLDVKAKLWDKARAEFEQFLIANPATKKIAKLVAKYEKNVKHNEAAGKSWEKRVQKADDECLFVCKHCGKTSLKWLPFCNSCGSFNPFEWCLCVLKKANIRKK